MYVEVVMIACSFAAAAGYPTPLHTGHGDRSALWDHFSQLTNQVRDKVDNTQQAEISKQVKGLWKNSLENVNLYTESLTPFTLELRSKLSLETDKLRVQIMKELVDLREKMSPHADEVHHKISRNVAQLRQRLALPASKLSSMVQQITGQLCRQLRGLDTKTLGDQIPDHEEDVLHRIRQTVQDSKLKLAPYLAEFQAEALRAVGELQESLSPHAREVQDELQQHAVEASRRLTESVEQLRAHVDENTGRLCQLSESEGLRGQIEQRVSEFCQGASSYADSFTQGIAQDFRDLSQSRAPVSLTLQDRGRPLEEDFSAKLRSLLEDIQHNLNSPV
ncbi:apolipoprotein A-IV-like [Acipenser oxyrinchus oxyrinchus]|uniref:Apolipoprotein A-IV n=1 Tax=Acipenser oxyrinchus oxyrinchus TaxID=40147 RepID=A0AAD8CLQ4_ACIOX|nr:apolipoprotein A-IV-like [Acipenser oxyrinchus oxyrinchus]